MDTQTKKKHKRQKPASISAIRMLAAEDVEPGHHVTIVHTTYEYVSPCDDAWSRTTEPRRVTMMPHDAGRPLKVQAVCLPFVLVKDPLGRHTTIDLRRNRLARLPEAYAKEASQRLRPASNNA